MKNNSKIDISKLVDGTKVLVHVVDELDPKAGNPTDLVTGECGIFCQVEFAHIMPKRTNDILEGKVSIYAGL